MINDFSNKLQIGKPQAPRETKIWDIAIIFYLDNEVLWISKNIKYKWLYSNKLQIRAGEAQAPGETKMLDIAIIFYLDDEVF